MALVGERVKQKSKDVMVKTHLREILEKFGLGSPTALGAAIGASRQYADQLLTGKRPYGIKVARKIAQAVGVSVAEVVSWQENGR